MNFRSFLIEIALRVVTSRSHPHRLNALEIGTMFNDNEGFSTLIIANKVKKFNGPKAFVSIDNDQMHINSSIEILKKVDSGLLKETIYFCDDSLDRLPKVLKELESIDFALLDGGAHPEICLREFEIVLEYLSDKGIILLDDLQAIAPSEAYPFPRPFGKGTLILPWLTIVEYLKGQNQKGDKSECDSVSELHSLLPKNKIIHILGKVDFTVISNGSHKMMAIGNRRVIDDFKKKLSELEMK